MKKAFVLLVASLAFAAGQPLISPRSGGASADEAGIPLPVGQFSVTAKVSFVLCLNPNAPTQTEPRSKSGAVAVPLTELDNGSIFHDSTGNFCGTVSAFDSLVPLAPSSPANTSPPTVSDSDLHPVGKVVDYYATTGLGHRSATIYKGGTCNGASFNSQGATIVNGNAEQFVVTSGGTRLEFLNLSFTNPAVGSFSGSGTELRQTNQNES